MLRHVAPVQDPTESLHDDAEGIELQRDLLLNLYILIRILKYITFISNTKILK